MANFENGGGGALSKEDEDERKMFIGGVGWDTTVEDLQDYFSRYGVVSHCTLKSESATGQNRGFGFVIFEDKNAITKVLQDKQHVIKGRVVDPKRALARGGREAERKIFVGGLDPSMTEEEVKTYFTRYGKVEYIDMPYDRVKGIRRGFCFITFDADDAVDRAVSVPRQRIGTRDCDVKRGMTRDELVTTGDTRAARGGGRNFTPRGRGGRGRGGGGGGGSGGYGGGSSMSGGAGGYGGGAPQGWQQGGQMGGGPDYSMGPQGYYGSPSSDYGMGGYGGGGYGAYNAYAAQGAPQQAYGAPTYSYQDYYGGQVPAQAAAGWGGSYGTMPAYGSTAYTGGAAAPPQAQQQSTYGKVKRGQSAGAAAGYHPYQR